MATGLVSSQPSAVAPTGVLKSGERLASTSAALKNPKAKTYYHMVKGARFIMPDGLEVHFMGGQVTVEDEAVIAELDKVANKSTSMIFTQKEGMGAVAAQNKMAADDAVTS